MDYLKEYDYMVQRFLPGEIIRDIGYDVRECSDSEVDKILKDEINIKEGFWGENDTEFENNLKNIIRMYPLVFSVPKAVQRIQQLCMLYDIISVPDDKLEKARLSYPNIERNSSYGNIKTYVISLTNDFNNSDKLSKVFPSDHIIVDDEVTEKIENIWNKDGKNISAPCDLINTQMLPAPDIEIQLDDTTYRVMINLIVNDLEKENVIDNRRKHIGFIAVHSSKMHKDITVEISEDISGLICMEKAVLLNPKEKMLVIDYFELCQMTSNIMRIWYGLQLLMLHPKIKYIFEHPKMQSFYNIYSRSTNKKRKITYSIKTIKIVNSMLDIQVKNTNDGHRVYTCPLWWVRGFKRNKKSKEEWVHGYWKGELRDLGKPQEYEVRERKFK